VRERKVHKDVLDERYDEKRPLAKSRSRFKDNIMDLSLLAPEFHI
jgi:hypothetical protein